MCRRGENRLRQRTRSFRIYYPAEDGSQGVAGIGAGGGGLVREVVEAVILLQRI